MAPLSMVGGWVWKYWRGVTLRCVNPSLTISIWFLQNLWCIGIAGIPRYWLGSKPTIVILCCGFCLWMVQMRPCTSIPGHWNCLLRLGCANLVEVAGCKYRFMFIIPVIIEFFNEGAMEFWYNLQAPYKEFFVVASNSIFARVRLQFDWWRSEH